MDMHILCIVMEKIGGCTNGETNTGGGGGNGANVGGGGGGYTTTVLGSSVTPGDTIAVIVGDGDRENVTNPYEGQGAGGSGIAIIHWGK